MSQFDHVLCCLGRLYSQLGAENRRFIQNLLISDINLGTNSITSRGPLDKKVIQWLQQIGLDVNRTKFCFAEAETLTYMCTINSQLAQRVVNQVMQDDDEVQDDGNVAYSNAWNARTSSNLLRSFSLDDDGDIEMEIDEAAVESLCVQPGWQSDHDMSRVESIMTGKSHRKRSPDVAIEDVCCQPENHVPETVANAKNETETGITADQIKPPLPSCPDLVLGDIASANLLKADGLNKPEHLITTVKAHNLAVGRNGHSCFGSTVLKGLLYAKKYGIPREIPGEKVFDCRIRRILSDDEELRQISDIFWYDSLDKALIRLQTHPVGATLTVFEDWTKRKHLCGPLYAKDLIDEYVGQEKNRRLRRKMVSQNAIQCWRI